MSNTYDDASLILYPSGYKASKLYSLKPTDGSGDLDVVRATGATRVGPDGLIEKVRTNLFLQSNGFDTASWGKGDGTITAGQLDPDGGSTAFLFQATAVGQPNLSQSYSASARTISVFAKAGTRSSFSIIANSFNNGAEFNLATATATAAGVGSLAKIEAVGGGYFRCSVFLSTSSVAHFFLTDIAGSGSVITDNMFFAFAQSETGDIATPYIPTTTAAVSVGMLANVPRIDYTGGGCGKLLLEPQRTNIFTFSEQFDNADWTKRAGIILTTNNAISPDGFQNADRIQFGTSVDGYVFQVRTIAASTAHTISVFAKGTGTIQFNIYDGTAGFVSSAFALTSTYQRLTFTMTTSSVTSVGDMGFFVSDSAEVYGAALEVGSYPTSYIPTLAAAVTRNADEVSKTGISALINSSEGVLYAEIAALADDLNIEAISISDGSSANRVVIFKFNTSNQIRARITSGGASIDLDFNLSDITDMNKIAIKYKTNDFALWINGVEVATNTSGSNPSGLNKLAFNSDGGAGAPFFGNAQNLMIFPTALTDAELETLTTL